MALSSGVTASHPHFSSGAPQGFPCGSAGKESACNAGDPGLLPGLRRTAGEGTGNPPQYSWAPLVAQLVKNLPAMQNQGDPGSIPGSGRSSGEGIGYTLQYSGLENSTDCIVHGVSKNQTRLSDFHFYRVLNGIKKLLFILLGVIIVL